MTHDDDPDLGTVDTDGDGDLTKSELESAFSGLSSDRLTKFLQNHVKGGALTLTNSANKWVNEVGIYGSSATRDEQNVIKRVSTVLSNPKAWIVSSLVGGLTMAEAKARLSEEGTSALDIIVNAWIFEAILLPVAESIWAGGLALIGAILTIIYGSDHAVGISPNSTVGLVDIPEVILGPFADLIYGTGSFIAGAIHDINSFGAAFAPLGLPAPILVNVFYAIEILGIIWLGYVFFTTVDIPLVNQSNFVSAITGPFKNLIDLFT